MAKIPELRRAVREWLATAALPEQEGDFDKRYARLREWHRTLYRAGWVGLQWPTTFGGHGLTAAHQLAVTEEIVRAGAPQPVGAIGLDVVGPTILRYGNDEQRERFVRPILSGDEVWCQGFSEPDAGSDLGSLRTRGVLTDHEIVITGQKVWTSWAQHADWCAVLVRTDPAAPKHQGISYVLVDMTSAGLTVRPIVQITGDAEFSELFLDEVRVPRANLLGPVNGGWPLVMDTLGHERAAYAIRRRLENELSFDRLLADLRTDRSARFDPQLCSQLGDLYVQLRGFEALSQNTAQRLVSGQVPSPLDSVDKLVLANTEQQLFGTALDLLGPYRMAPGHRPRGLDSGQIIKDYLYGRAASVYGGSAQIQRSLIAERLLGLPRGAR
jgi:alkylation response protein AidB-like acyl-CoA dehydrogenase